MSPALKRNASWMAFAVVAYIVAVLLIVASLVLVARIGSETESLILSGKTPAALTAKRAADKAAIFDTYTHAILCDSLLLNKKELIGHHSVEVIVEAMLAVDCKGIVLP